MEHGERENNVSGHLLACIDLEQRCAELYNMLAGRFPEKGLFFRELSQSEDRHANLLSMAIGLKNVCAFPVGPHGNKFDMQAAHAILAELMQRVDEPGISLTRDIVPLLMRLEEMSAEGYLHELMTGKIEDGVLRYLRRFYEDEKSHLERVRELMKEES